MGRRQFGARTIPARGGGAERRGVEERLDQADPRRVGQAARVAGVERDHRRGPVERRERGLVSPRPGAVRALVRDRGLGQEIGDAERLADARADPVGRLIIEVIGEPCAWALVRRARPVAPQQPLGHGRPDALQARLIGRITRAVPAAQSAGQFDLVPGPRQRLDQQPGHAPVTRGNRMVGRLQRGVEGDPHGPAPIRPPRWPAPGRSAWPAPRCRPSWRTARARARPRPPRAGPFPAARS